MSNPKIPFTKQGLEKVEKELSHFQERRKIAVRNLQTAREMGDLSENGAYKAARAELSFVDSRIRRLDMFSRLGKVIEARDDGIIAIGSRVTLSDGKDTKEYLLVGGFESNPKEAKLSTNSPIGKQLVGKTAGDTIVVYAPIGEQTYSIISVE